MSCRLPTTVTPNHYDLTYNSINLSPPYSFSGVVKISIQVSKDAPNNMNSITLHCLEIAISEATLSSSSSTPTHATSINYSPSNETCTLVFPTPINPSTSLLTVTFTGVLNDQMRGLYRSTYKGQDGEIKTMACTQFEATDARRAFPCWDEPSFKSTFRLTCKISQTPTFNPIAISNTTIVSSITNHERGGSEKSTTYKFEVTPVMSTYLLALVIGEFDQVGKNSEKTKIRTTVYTAPGKGMQGVFCLETACRALDFLEDTYGVPYPLPKSDLLAIPDFAAGAMENWGCVTYREAKILTSETGTSLAMRKGIARTVCHELAHQWFGNLTTMEWWNALFLNEGFARYMEFIAVNSLFPSWGIWDEFVGSVFVLALSLDAMDTSHPIEVEVNHPDEINSIFDSISYAKGASLIRMIAGWLGEDVFMEGIKKYLRKFGYKNATSNDLWSTLGSHSGKDVVGMMEKWTKVMGFPVITIGKDGSVVQEKFRAGGRKDGLEVTDWRIPITFADGEMLVMGIGEDEMVAEKIRQGKGGKINKGQVGFYRVNYSTDVWASLSKEMGVEKMSNTDRLGLVSDVFALAKGGYQPVTVALDFVKPMAEIAVEDEFVVWSEVCDKLIELSGVYKGEDFEDSYKAFVKEVVGKQWEMIGWEKKEGEKDNKGSMRGVLLSAMAASGDEGVKKEALRLFNVYYGGGKEVAADIRKVVYKLAVSEDEDNVLPKMRDLFSKTTFPEEQRNLMVAMGGVKGEMLWKETIDWVLFSGQVKKQDAVWPLSTLGGGGKGEMAFEYFKENHERLKERFTGPIWGGVVAMCSRGVKDIETVVDYFKDKDVGNAKRRLAQAIEGGRLREARLKRDMDALKGYWG
mmetsp:Transcript_20082/g.42041  ORF Transcript_20082/g.42041 Transcript_20082/m.42041 type:complete len:860 (-) Transcript_20082:2-2581(-)